MISKDSSEGFNPLFHLRSTEEELCDEAVELISTGRKGNETLIALKILGKIDVGAPSNVLLRLNRILSKAEEAKLDRDVLSKVADVCIDMIWPGFSKKSIGEQIAFAKETGQQTALVQFLVQRRSGILDEVFEKWSDLGLDIQQNLELCRYIASQGEWGVWILVENFNRLGLDIKDRLELCHYVALQEISAAVFLAMSFAKLGLERAEVKDRLELCNIIVSQGKSAKDSLAKNFKELGFLQDINRLPQVEDRLELWKLIASQGGWAAKSLIRHLDFAQLEFAKAKVEDRLALCKTIVLKSDSKTFAKLGFLEDINKLQPLEKRLKLCEEIASQGRWAAGCLAISFTELGLERATVEDRLRLCKMIASQGELARQQLFINSRALGFLEDIIKLPKVEDRLKLCTKIASQGEWAVRFLASNFDSIELEGATVEDLLGLCKMVASQGEWAAQFLAENFNMLGLQEAEGACVSLAQIFAAAGYQRTFDCSGVSLSIKNDTIKRQIYLELWRPPSDYRGESWYLHSLSAGFTSELEPILNVLHRQEGIPYSIYKESLTTFLNKNEKLTWLLPLLEEIETKEEFIQFALLDFMAYAVGVLYDLTDGQVEAIKQSGMVQDIFNHENPLNRYHFMRLLSDVAKHNPADLMSRPIRKEWDHASLTRVLLSHLFASEKNPASIEKIIERIDVKAFKPISKFNSIVQFLLSINDHGPYTDSELSIIRKAVADVIGQKKGKKSDPVKIMLSKINSLTTLLNVFGKEEFLSCLREKKDPIGVLQSHFQHLFDVGEVQQFGEKYQNTFGKFRDETALYTYARCVNSLPRVQKERVRGALSVYVRAVLEGTFPDIRYDTTTSSHLAQVFSAPDIQSKWCVQQQAIQVSLASEAPLGASDYKTFFTQKILTDEHIDPVLLPRLVSYLNTEQGEIIDSTDPLEQLQNFAIQLLRRDIIDVEEFIRKVVALRDIPQQFLLDLEALNPKKVAGDCTIQESDEACDLLLIGKEIQGSCQSVDGSPHLNRALVSYLMNGEVRPIVIKQNGRLVARSVMRLMWDETNQTPVILLERVYSNVAGTQPAKYILEWAKQKAESMGLPLVGKEVGGGPSYLGDVGHLGGFSPFVYSDATGGGVLEGPFQTKKCHALYLPTTIKERTL